MDSDSQPMLGNEASARKDVIVKCFPHKTVSYLSITTLSLAIFVFINGVSLLVYTAVSQNAGTYFRCNILDPAYMASGIWCGILFGATAFCGLKAAQYRNACFIVALLVLATVSAVLACIHTVASILGGVNCTPDYNRFPYLGMSILSAVLGFIEMMLFVVTGIITCRSACCDPSPEYMSQILEIKKPRKEQISQPAPLVPGSQIVYASSGSGTDMKPFFMVPINQPGLVANMQPQAFPPVMIQAQSTFAAAKPDPMEQDDQPLIEA